MKLSSRIAGEADRWLNNGANIITLLRLPMLAGVIYGVGALAGFLPLLGWSAAAMFWFAAFMQAAGMATDGLDGWFARRHSRRGPTPEGQFLDQFIDKVFVWVAWWLLSAEFCRQGRLALDQPHSLAWWWCPALMLFFLDIKSCRKHWYNYLRDRGKPVNLRHGAVWQGKWKFVAENVVVCMLLGTLAPSLPSPSSSSERAHEIFRNFTEVMSLASPAFLYTAIALACWSLLTRTRLTRREESPPERFAEAAVDHEEGA